MSSLSLSVIVPTRNRARLLNRALKSVVGCSAEVVVVDDGSEDDTPEIVQRYARRGVRYIALPERRGPCYARNVGIAQATGDYVLLLDDDDVLLTDATEVIGKALAGSIARLYFFNCLHSDNRLSIPNIEEPVRYSYEDWLRGRFASELKPVIKREVFNHHKFEDTGASGEGLLWGRLLRKEPAIVVGTPIIRYDAAAGADRLTSAKGLLQRASENALIARLWLDEFGDDLARVSRQRWAERMFAAAAYALLAGRRQEARRILEQIPARVIAAPKRFALVAASLMPLSFVRLLFLIQRRSLVSTVRSGGLWQVIRGL
jgi:glycosyltransferase involved in cell wall biosynthesis